MKRLFIASSLLCLPLLYSCNNEEIENFSLENQSVALEDGILKFSSEDEYFKVIEEKNFKKKPDFISLSQAYAHKESTANARILENTPSVIDEFEGSALLEILNEDGMVEIDENLFYLDFVNQLVCVTSNKQLKDDLLDGDYSDESVRLFSFEDDVFELMGKGVYESVTEFTKATLEKSTKSENGSHLKSLSPILWTSGCDWNKCSFTDETSGLEHRFRVEMKHVYQSAGIYFRLFSEAKHMRKPIGGAVAWSPTATSMTLNYNVAYKSKRNGSSPFYEVSNRVEFNNHLKRIYYESSRGLDRYRLDSTFDVWAGGDYDTTLGLWEIQLKRISKGSI